MNPTINPQATGLQVFYNENENVSIRTEVINGEPWFVAKDIAMALNITWSGHTLDRIPEEWKTMVSFTVYESEDAVTGVRRTAFINESAMYKLAFRSNKPEADRFVNWITGTVLPSIRRTGSFSQCISTSSETSSRTLPLPKFRPYFDKWKEHVSPYVSQKELTTVAYALAITLSMSGRFMRVHR